MNTKGLGRTASVAAALVVSIVLAAVTTARPAGQRGGTADPGGGAIAAADAFLATLEPAKRQQANVALTPDNRSRWTNLPTGAGNRARNGIKFGDLTPVQERAALALVAATLSPSGYQKVLDIVTADQVLEDAAQRAPGSAVRFGRAEYHIAVLGTPSATSPWMMQFGGHHLAINVTMAGTRPVLTPTHTGTQPAIYTIEGRTVRPLGDENDKAFALVNALTDAQRAAAILNYPVTDVVAGPGQDGRVIQPEGARVATFTAAQRKMLMDLVGEWVGILNDRAASARMTEIEGALNDTYFAWSGPTTSGSKAYFRIQGPTALIEYAPQGGPTATDHIHTFYRDPTNDYGVKVIGSQD